MSGSNRIVRVPIHRHVPFGCGVNFTGVVADASVCDVTAIIGRLNVTLSSGASGTGPSGIQRSTCGSMLLSAAKVVETAWATSRAGPMKPATGRRAATH